MNGINCGYKNHTFEPTGKHEIIRSGAIVSEFECTKCGISTYWDEKE